MKKILFLFLVLIVGCAPKKEIKTMGSVERLDPALDNYLDINAVPEVIAEGFDWSEGPVWIESEKMLLFSDVPTNTIYKWTEAGGLEKYLQPSGYTSDIPRGGEVGSNGLTLNNDGKLVLCQHGDRRIALFNSDFKNPQPNFTTLAGGYDGKRFNSPNDVIFDSQGNFYFTDPPYGLLKNMEDSSKELSYQGVYKVKPDGSITLLVDSLTRPNGIGLSPDDQTLYIGNSDGPTAKWYSFKIVGDSLTDARIFYWTKYKEGEKGAPDGLRVHSSGAIFATGPGGIWIFDPSGKALGRILIPESTANCEFSADEKTLFTTSDNYLLRIKLK
jgi:gluconolactonase